jgi:hypothetical protein
VGGEVQLGPLGTAATDWPIVPAPGWLWWRIWWNEDWQGKSKYSEKTCPSATLSTTNPTWPYPGSNPGRRGGKPATNRLSYGAACIMKLDKYIMTYEILSMAFLISNTNITASQIVAVITVMLLKCLNSSSWNYVLISCHLGPFQPTLYPLKLHSRHETWYVCRAIWGHLSDVHHKSLSSVIPTIWPLKL